MKITAIKQQIKRPDRYSIYIDGKYSFSLSEAELLQTKLRLNREFSEAELQQLRQTAVLDKAYDRTLNLISHRLRSEWELRDYMRRKDYEPDVIEATIERLMTRGYVNDEIFARRWVENRRLLKATSKRRLAQELKQKRVNEEVIQRVLAEDETDEQAVLRELIARKRKQTKYQDELKLMQYLARQGFNYDAIKTAMNEE